MADCSLCSEKWLKSQQGMDEGSASLPTPEFCLERQMEILQKRVVWREAFIREDSSSNMDRNSKQSMRTVEVGVVGGIEILLA